MRISSWTAAIVASVLTFSAGLAPVWAQGFPNTNRPPVGGQPTGQPSGGNGFGAPAGAPRVATLPSAPQAAPAQVDQSLIYVVDIGLVFKNHGRFNAAREALLNERKALEADVTSKQTAVMKGSEQLKTYNPGSPEFKQLEEKLAKETSNVKVDIALKQKDMAEREAKIYFNTYNEIYDIVRDFAERNNARLVLSYSKQEMEPNKPDSVLRGVNRPIVYQRNLDITDQIIAIIARTSPATNPGVSRVPNTSPQIPRPGVGTAPGAGNTFRN